MPFGYNPLSPSAHLGNSLSPLLQAVMNAAQLPVDGLETAARKLVCELVRNDRAATEHANQVIRSLLSVSIQVRIFTLCVGPSCETRHG